MSNKIERVFLSFSSTHPDMAKVIDQYVEYYAKDRLAWRKWLLKNHLKEKGVWLIYYKKTSDKTRVSYVDAVKEALCFGWIDTTSRPIDEFSYKQLFVPRKEKSSWSKLNKSYVEKLTKQGLMTEAGLEKVLIAKQNGHWEKLDHVEALTIPPDFEKALAKSKKATKFFNTLKGWNLKYLLYWLHNAKREETRQARIKEIMDALKQEKMPERFTRKPKKSK
jgi:uncharacterized protein YdeI (YjbR/CyaY-like superfamily)